MARSRTDMRRRKLLLPKATVARAGDSTFTSTGDVYAADPVGGTVTVNVRGGAVTLPAVADRYSGSSLARVLHDPFSGRPVQVLGAVFPDAPVQTLGVSGTATGVVTVTLPAGGVLPASSVDVPAPTGSFTVGGTAYVLTDGWGLPVFALAVASVPAVAPPAPKPKPAAPTTVKATARITPTWSGTYRSGAWDNWNQYRYGGKSDIYQGSEYGSGLLQGLATYGSAVHNLGAVSIQKITMSAYKNGDGLSATLQVQGASYASKPSGAPSGSGDTASVHIGSGGWGTLTFTANMCEAFRTGSAKSLVAVGGDYGGFGGTGHSGSFVLNVWYTKRA